MPVTIMPKTANVKVGATQHLTVTGTNDNKPPNYTINGDAGGAVDAQGNYIGKRAGSDTVTVQNTNGETGTSVITVAA